MDISEILVPFLRLFLYFRAWCEQHFLCADPPDVSVRVMCLGPLCPLPPGAAAPPSEGSQAAGPPAGVIDNWAGGLTRRCLTGRGRQGATGWHEGIRGQEGVGNRR